MKNVHQRHIALPIEKIRPWIEAGWTGGADDPFPHDVIKSWRKNPAGTDPGALIPGVTRLGHGMFRFRFQSWDGQRFRVRVENVRYDGWHGFDLEPTAEGCRVTHTLDVALSGSARVVWPVCFAALHDWAVEAVLDRIEEAARSGTMPTRTTRPIAWPASAWFRLLRR
jgi:hypothetical protein